MSLNKLKEPNTYFIISLLVVVVAVLTWIIPPGEFNRVERDGKEVVVADSYHVVEKNPQGIGDVLMSPINGFVDAALIIGFVLIVGGAFGVFQKTEAVDAGIKSIAQAYEKSEIVRAALIPIFMTLFSLAGAVFGMSEETIPFILIFVPMALTLGYDSITGVAIPFVGAGAGFASAFINPFTLGIAQGIAELPPLSGLTYRVIVWFVVTSIAIFFVSRYAHKIKKDPRKSLTYEIDEKKRKNLNLDEIQSFEGMDRKHKLALIAFAAGLIILVAGVLIYGWYIEEICAVFVFTGIAVGIAGRLTAKEITDAFVEGAKTLAGTALVIALARGILIIASDGKIIDTMLYALSHPVGALHPIISSQVMFIIQSAINFFVPSGSGQAALTMPVMAPLGDIVGVPRQTAVLAFQFGDGFTNLIIPTSPVMMAVLALADIPWAKWAKWMLPLQIIFAIVALILLIPPFLFGW